MKNFKVHDKNIYLQIVLWNDFVCEKNVFGVVIKLEHSNVSCKLFEIWYIYLLYMCTLLKNFKNDFLFVSFEENILKNIY